MEQQADASEEHLLHHVDRVEVPSLRRVVPDQVQDTDHADRQVRRAQCYLPGLARLD